MSWFSQYLPGLESGATPLRCGKGEGKGRKKEGGGKGGREKGGREKGGREGRDGEREGGKLRLISAKHLLRLHAL